MTKMDKDFEVDNDGNILHVGWAVSRTVMMNVNV